MNFEISLHCVVRDQKANYHYLNITPRLLDLKDVTFREALQTAFVDLVRIARDVVDRLQGNMLRDAHLSLHVREYGRQGDIVGKSLTLRDTFVHKNSLIPFIDGSFESILQASFPYVADIVLPNAA